MESVGADSLVKGLEEPEDEMFDVNISDDEFRDVDQDKNTEDVEMKEIENRKPLKERLSFEQKPSAEYAQETVHKQSNYRSSRSNNRSVLHKPLVATRDCESSVLGKEIAFKLGERKVELISKAVEVLGSDTILEMFETTKKIEKKGGLCINNGNRRRTPGGVFLFIMKEYRYASSQQVKEIYKVDKEIMRQGTRDKKKRQKLRKKAEIEALKEELKQTSDL